MSWFRIEDSFHSHPKVAQAGNAAVGLWVRCGTWSAQYLTDGTVPMNVIDSFGRQREVEALVAARLWVPTDEAMLMPDFLEYNPSRADVQRRRKDDAERKQAERRNVDRSDNGQYISRRQP